MELDDKGTAVNIFNASDSVWLAFTHNLYDAQRLFIKHYGLIKELGQQKPI